MASRGEEGRGEAPSDTAVNKTRNVCPKVPGRQGGASWGKIEKRAPAGGHPESEAAGEAGQSSSGGGKEDKNA